MLGGHSHRAMAAGQMTLWPRKAIIYRNLGPVMLKEREGEVAWGVLHSSVPRLLSPLISVG